MALIKSISGIRGTIGGTIGTGLNPVDIARFTAAYATHIKTNKKTDSNKIVVGRDARISGEMLSQLVIGSLLGMGFDVINLGLATTPTTEFAVTAERAAGGIILTASHNPKQWNALKMLNEHGEFLTAKDAENLLQIAENESYIFADVNNLGKLTDDFTYTKKHIDKILALDLVDAEAIRAANFTVSVDAVNSVGGLAVPELLDALGVKNVIKLHCEPNGHFAHDPEPLPENLTEISGLMKKISIDVGFAVDPDVDRLSIICEDGTMFGEEYTLVSLADYVLQHTPGNTVSNMSSTRALRDITEKYGYKHAASAVGEVNVVTMMKATNAVIGGEGNGGVIYPANHYGRDALAAIALFLTYLAKSKLKVSELRATYPNYFVRKKKIELTPAINIEAIFNTIKESYQQYEINDADGVKIDFPQGWVHLRKSNTEPVIRIFSEGISAGQAENFANTIVAKVKRLAEFKPNDIR